MADTTPSGLSAEACQTTRSTFRALAYERVLSSKRGPTNGVIDGIASTGSIAAWIVRAGLPQTGNHARTRRPNFTAPSASRCPYPSDVAVQSPIRPAFTLALSTPPPQPHIYPRLEPCLTPATPGTSQPRVGTSEHAAHVRGLNTHPTKGKAVRAPGFTEARPSVAAVLEQRTPARPSPPSDPGSGTAFIDAAARWRVP